MLRWGNKPTTKLTRINDGEYPFNKLCYSLTSSSVTSPSNQNGQYFPQRSIWKIFPNNIFPNLSMGEEFYRANSWVLYVSASQNFLVWYFYLLLVALCSPRHSRWSVEKLSRIRIKIGLTKSDHDNTCSKKPTPYPLKKKLKWQHAGKRLQCKVI